MSTVLTPKQLAFDAAIKARRNALYLGLADLDELRQQGELSGPLVEQLIDIRTAFNGALAEQLANSDAVVALLGLSRDTDRKAL